MLQDGFRELQIISPFAISNLRIFSLTAEVSAVGNDRPISVVYGRCSIQHIDSDRVMAVAVFSLSVGIATRRSSLYGLKKYLLTHRAPVGRTISPAGRLGLAWQRCRSKLEHGKENVLNKYLYSGVSVYIVCLVYGSQRCCSQTLKTKDIPRITLSIRRRERVNLDALVWITICLDCLACYRERCLVARVSGTALEACPVRCSRPASNAVAGLSIPVDICENMYTFTSQTFRNERETGRSWKDRC